MSDPSQTPDPGAPEPGPAAEKADEELPGEPAAEPAAEPAGEAGRRRPAGFDDKGRVRRTRSSAAWVGAVVAALLMVLLLVFIVQNSDPVRFRFFGWEGEMPLAVAVLLAAVAGVLLVAIPGSLRIFQLRRALVANQKRAGR
jgi:uncharacterized integral membrane protein